MSQLKLPPRSEVDALPWGDDDRPPAEVKPTPYNPLLLGLARLAGLLPKAVQDAPFQPWANPLAGIVSGAVSNLFGLEGTSRALERAAYGEPLFGSVKGSKPLVPSDTADLLLNAAPLGGPAARLLKGPTKAAPSAADLVRKSWGQAAATPAVPQSADLFGGIPIPAEWFKNFPRLNYSSETGGPLPRFSLSGGLDNYAVLPADPLRIANKLAPLKIGDQSHVGDLVPELRDLPIAHSPVKIASLTGGTRGQYAPDGTITLGAQGGNQALKAEVLGHEITHAGQDKSRLIGVGSTPKLYQGGNLAQTLKALADFTAKYPALGAEADRVVQRAIKNPFSVYEGDIGEAGARVGGALQLLPGRLPSQAVLESLIRREEGKSPFGQTFMIETPGGPLPFPVSLLESGEIRFNPDIFRLGGTFSDRAGNLLGRKWMADADSRDPRFKFKDPSLVVTRGVKSPSYLHPDRQAYPSFAITKDGLPDRYGTNIIVPNLDALEPRTAPVVIKNRDFYSPRRDHTGLNADWNGPSVWEDSVSQEASRLEQARAELHHRFGTGYPRAGTYQEGAKAYFAGGDRPPRFISRTDGPWMTEYDTLRLLRFDSPRFQSWKHYEDSPRGARLLVPPDSMLHKTDKMAWNEEFLGSLGDLGSRKRALRAMDDGIDPETRRVVEAASRAFRNIRSNYGEAKQFGPARFSPDNTRLLMVRQLDDLPDEVRQALAVRGLPVEAHGGDLNAAYEMARAAQRGQRFMPIKPVEPVKAGEASSDLPSSVVKHFGLDKVAGHEMSTYMLNSYELKALQDLPFNLSPGAVIEYIVKHPLYTTGELDPGMTVLSLLYAGYFKSWEKAAVEKLQQLPAMAGNFSKFWGEKGNKLFVFQKFDELEQHMKSLPEFSSFDGDSPGSPGIWPGVTSSIKEFYNTYFKHLTVPAP